LVNDFYFIVCQEPDTVIKTEYDGDAFFVYLAMRVVFPVKRALIKICFADNGLFTYQIFQLVAVTLYNGINSSYKIVVLLVTQVVVGGAAKIVAEFFISSSIKLITALDASGFSIIFHFP
jgi:hypothetical protein